MFQISILSRPQIPMRTLQIRHQDRLIHTFCLLSIQEGTQLFRKSSVAEAITNTDYAGEITAYGDTVRIIKEPVITVYQYERGQDVTQTKLTDQEVNLVVDTANAFKFIVDDIETSMSHVNFKELHLLQPLTHCVMRLIQV